MEIYVVKAGDTLGTTAACRYISDKETDIGEFKMSQSIGQKFTPLKLLKFAFPSMVIVPVKLPFSPEPMAAEPVSE